MRKACNILCVKGRVRTQDLGILRWALWPLRYTPEVHVLTSCSDPLSLARMWQSLSGGLRLPPGSGQLLAAFSNRPVDSEDPLSVTRSWPHKKQLILIYTFNWHRCKEYTINCDPSLGPADLNLTFKKIHTKKNWHLRTSSSKQCDGQGKAPTPTEQRRQEW